jgi:hypothetical protein
MRYFQRRARFALHCSFFRPKIIDVLYEFECECGHAQAIQAPMKAAPALGSQRSCGQCGRNTLTRVISRSVQIDAGVKAKVWGYPYICRQWSELPLTQQDENGHSIIESPQHERNVIAAARDQRGLDLYRE